MKTKKEIQIIITHGETYNVEFKSKLDADKTGRALCALANDWAGTGGGILILGVSDKTKTIVGIDGNDDEIQKSISNLVRDSINPTYAPVVYSMDLGKRIIVVEIGTHPESPCRFRENCYIRVGTTTRRASFIEELKLYERKKAEGKIHALVDRLPPLEKPTSFIGRQNELELLWKWFRDSREYRCALSGDGGKGKTAIAYEFAKRIADSSPGSYEIVLWASAKQRRFVGGETVAIPNPDFTDLSSLLDKLINDIGFSEEKGLGSRERQDKLLELLTMFPALIVIDDLDSLDWNSDVETMSFLTFHLPQTKSKILVTSRRQIPTLPTIFITGFTEPEGIDFIDSRLEISGTLVNILSKEQKKTLLGVTDSSPLYIEDFLRLFLTVGDWKETVQQWTSRTGDEARAYALKREYEMLSDDAQKVILAFSLLDQPATSAEAKIAANLSWAKWNDAAAELQRLFLISKPGLIEGVPRYSLNSNTKALVLSIMENNPELLRIKQAINAIKGENYRDSSLRKSVGSYINQARAQIITNNPEGAETIIKTGLTKIDQDPDLIGALGWVYKCFTPARNEEARECFVRASDLKCNSPEMYRHWYEMEERLKNWKGMIDCADAALRVFPDNQLWTYRLGDSLNRHGEVLYKQLQPRARVYLSRANKIIRKSLRQSLGQSQAATIKAKAYRLLVNNSLTQYVSAIKTDNMKFKDQLKDDIRDWARAYPEDPDVDFEIDNMLTKYPELKD